MALRARFADDPFVSGVTPVKAMHSTELRSRIDALRRAEGLQAFRWTDRVLTLGVTPVSLTHLLEPRQALAAVYRRRNGGFPVGPRKTGTRTPAWWPTGS